MRKLFIPLILIGLLLTACNNNTSSNHDGNTTNDSIGIPEESHMEPVPFALGQNYFVKNKVPEDKNGAFKLESQEAFDEFFSPAASMGDSGIPSKIDFEKEFVIAIISASSDLKPSIDSISLNKEGAELLLKYKESFGEKQSFTMRPQAILIVEKKFDGTLKPEVRSSL
ncbi:hypothetical protein SMI01S_24280 [Sphingobacterium mizutaii NBRC 14946 = DSM 11724]|uniref:Lipoprotein n=2 Tax=Sphingobacterium mizutaii TaxID=1010 RepID=A0AAJ4XBD9_9SPHI|nr:hypothetical protein [Sphingobacterium mizutaii]GEM68822.1 hypothetical protein SMI01S_24280 [Sphingobacterium mizutaii NBRC 14946 = DSM 11724]SDL01473.1 hypothetical protein SAMN05192578_101849 [Sphingobacterium mizutaii]SNV50135.1 Uncharacterised protein [Sphingobacterium mizutaii]